MEQGRNARGSFGDVLLALAGGLLAADAARARNLKRINVAVGDRLVALAGSVDRITEVFDSHVVATREVNGPLINHKIGQVFHIDRKDVDRFVATGIGIVVSPDRPDPYAFRATLRVRCRCVPGTPEFWRVDNPSGTHCYNPVTFVWERIDQPGASTHYTRFLSQQIAEGVRAQCTIAPPAAIADTTSVTRCTVEDPTQDHTADRAERNDVLINKTGHPLPSWPAAEDPIAEVDHKLNMVRLSTIAETDTHITVSKRHWAELRKSIARLSAGKVEKPAKLEKPSAAANTNELATAIEGAEPSPASSLNLAAIDDLYRVCKDALEVIEDEDNVANLPSELAEAMEAAVKLAEGNAPADPIAQAMALIPNTYVEEPTNICAAISNMVSHIDRLKRSNDCLTGADVLDRVCQSCRAAVKAAMGKGDIPGVVKTGQN